jgi:hypothetical protein
MFISVVDEEMIENICYNCYTLPVVCFANFSCVLYEIVWRLFYIKTSSYLK